MGQYYGIHVIAWVKVFKVSPKFRILGLTFHIGIRRIIIACLLYSFCLKTVDHLIVQLLILCRYTASCKI